MVDNEFSCRGKELIRDYGWYFEMLLKVRYIDKGIGVYV